ncbi:MAG: bifunctional phosphoribosylaminoimidazolecarboxamide formyltransferase/inosine monophosphate cyclohydrolase [Acidobacteria bacterium]|jgi:phosphoribosylaminoimidazolecarboxamide formyltransferase/IMP cyclohydrolase|nr:bifunctional phosphoribosylaminoimidazolecarboxamide formyltransferase/inosine monophosphate cyclohydrolase [Acidobacteriota bacterium]HJN43248.1 bifunctional phosphoribosylaminoimidazolecarboxamide formyltransferase/IMP cyclohydrolase [Vicinamibacterales bacterium]
MRALLSVSDKTNLADFARGLVARGYELVSTGGTARALAEAGLTVTLVSKVTGFPEMMDGRVKTLHPGVHGGILARRDRSDDMQAIAGQGIEPIDVVVVNLYPFARAAADRRTTVEALIEEIDIGGPSLVRAAAKNFRHVVVVVDPADYRTATEQLDLPNGPSEAYRLSLACKAFAHTRSYDDTIASALSSVEVADGSFTRGAPPPEPLAPDTLAIKAARLRTLRYGENPHQTAALYADGAVGFGGAQVLQGKELSYTNLLDLDAAARLMIEFDEPAAVVVKHMNPCGVATAASLSEAYVMAREVDPLSAFGGIVGVNRPLDRDTATAITSTFIEAVVAPEADAEARAVFATKKNLRLVLADCAPAAADLRLTREVRSILGAVLVQEYDRVAEAASPWDASAASPDQSDFRVVTARQPTDEEWAALRLAWRVSAHVKSNAVVFAVADRLAAIGAGQMSRVDAVKVATMKATTDLSGTAAASDAFFPFRDGLDAIAAAGATAVAQPGGSVRDEEVIAAANEHGIAMVFTGRRHFRH